MLSDSEDAVDSRQWTQHHLAAADIRVPPTMALTPPQGEFEGDCMDVNVRGPGVEWSFFIVLSRDLPVQSSEWTKTICALMSC